MHDAEDGSSKVTVPASSSHRTARMKTAEGYLVCESLNYVSSLGHNYDCC